MMVNQNVDALTLTMFDEDVDEDHEFGQGVVHMSALKVDEILDQSVDLLKDGQCTAKLRFRSQWKPTNPPAAVQDKPVQSQPVVA